MTAGNPRQQLDSSSELPRRDRARRRGRARVEANARLTGGVAAVLLVLLAVEGVTVVRIGPLLTLHVVVGLLLVPPVLLKIASTSWRFARYYLGDPAYREKGPPPPALRLLGPFMVFLTLALFASGIALLLDPNGLGGRLLLIHRATFFVWFAVTAVHVLGHLIETGRLAPRDWMRRTRRRIPGASLRQLTIVASLALGAVLAAALVGQLTDFRHSYHSYHSNHGSGAVSRPAPDASLGKVAAAKTRHAATAAHSQAGGKPPARSR